MKHLARSAALILLLAALLTLPAPAVWRQSEADPIIHTAFDVIYYDRSRFPYMPGYLAYQSKDTGEEGRALLVYLTGDVTCWRPLNDMQKTAFVRFVTDTMPKDCVIVLPFTSAVTFYDMHPDALFNFIEYAAEEYNVDRERISICGFSGGAIAAQDVVGRHPDYFSAAVIVEGNDYFGKYDPDTLTGLPIDIFLSYADKGMSSTWQRPVARRINAAGGDCLVHALDVVTYNGHGIVERVFSDPEYCIIRWMLRQVRGCGRIGSLVNRPAAGTASPSAVSIPALDNNGSMVLY